jgi:N-acetylglucosaminyl-diphospho-decaprenol L-rhamnosyltransferase
LNSLTTNVETLDHLTVSVVSHGHSSLVLSLARQLASIRNNLNIILIVTINSPELDHEKDMDGLALISNITVILIKNRNLKGFGTNHNQAFRKCETEFFCVINPDIDLTNEPFTDLLKALKAPDIGLTYPRQIDGQNNQLDFERELASPISIGRRHLFRQLSQPNAYKPVHWVSGAFMVFKTSAFHEIGGFDERYYMYCEDVDICLRLQLAGYRLVRTETTVIHHTQRKTLKNLRHLTWHVRSLLRLWNSKVYKDYKLKFLRH